VAVRIDEARNDGGSAGIDATRAGADVRRHLVAHRENSPVLYGEAGHHWTGGIHRVDVRIDNREVGRPAAANIPIHHRTRTGMG